MEEQSWQLEVVPYLDASVRCVLEVPGTRTLEDLHQQILMAFSLPMLEGYAFFMNGDMDSIEFQYGPRITSAPHDSVKTRLDDLKFVQNKRFMYAFDEDEDCAFDVRVLTKGGPVNHAGKVISTSGDLEDVFSDLSFDGGDDEDDHMHHHAHDEEPDHGPVGHHHCAGSHADVSPELLSLAPVVRDRFSKWRAFEAERIEIEDGEEVDTADLPREDPGDVEADRRIVDRLLALTSGDPLKIHAGVEHTVGESVWPWIISLPGRLSETGQHDAAVAMSRQIDAVAPIRVKHLKLPVFLARAGHEPEVLAQIEENLKGAPEDMFALRYAGEALVILGDDGRAEAMLREALHWAGGNLDLRGEVLEHLLPVLLKHGKRVDAEKIVREETRRFEELVSAMADDADED